MIQQVHLSTSMAHGWNSNTWKIPSMLSNMQEIKGMKHLVPTNFPNIPNSMFYDNGVVTQRVVRKFLSSSSPSWEWGKLVWFSDIPPTKSLMLWKVLHNRLPTNKDVQMRGVFYIYFVQGLDGRY